MPEDVLSITHVIPHVGPTEIRLYSPADKLYKLLNKRNEIHRLKTLRHLGALSHALPGTRSARWDYTIALLYYAQCLDVPGMKSSFTIGCTPFSSALSALQSAALCWNIGHLPGTYPVEKGVFRWLYDANKKYPANSLQWPEGQSRALQRIRSAANEILRQQDYMGVARVLAVLKLLSMFDEGDSDIRNLVVDFAAPFLLSYPEGDSKQWHKLNSAFTIVRHLGYLTLDISLAGLEWCPSIPSLLRQEVAREGTDLQVLSDRICEILSPIERLVYASVYHRDVSRQEAAVVAEWVNTKLQQSDSPAAKISTWMNKGLFRELRIGRRPRAEPVALGGSIRLRTHFVGGGLSLVEIESLLRRRNFPFPLALSYQAWNSEPMIEPDELIIDASVRKGANPDDVGRLLAWMIRHYDPPEAAPDDIFELYQKADCEKAYLNLLKRAFELFMPGKTMAVEPWPLARFGLFPENPPDESRGCVWACDGKLENKIVAHIVRDRRKDVPAGLKSKYAELLGLRELRNHLRTEWRDKARRQRCLLVTASLRLRDTQRDLIEFDGGIAVISSRGGRITWYGLESKTRDTSACRSLKKRVEDLKLSVDVHKLSRRHAFARMVLKP